MRVDIDITTEYMFNEYGGGKYAFNITVAGWVVYQSPFMFSREEYALEDGEIYLRDRMIDLMSITQYVTKEEMYGDGR